MTMIDVSKRAWGRNYNVLKVIDDGKHLRLAVWSTPTPEPGDFLLLANGSDTTRYAVDAVEYAPNVRDMTFVDATFAPREQAALASQEA